MKQGAIIGTVVALLAITVGTYTNIIEETPFGQLLLYSVIAGIIVGSIIALSIRFYKKNKEAN